MTTFDENAFNIDTSQTSSETIDNIIYFYSYDDKNNITMKYRYEIN